MTSWVGAIRWDLPARPHRVGRGGSTTPAAADGIVGHERASLAREVVGPTAAGNLIASSLQDPRCRPLPHRILVLDHHPWYMASMASTSNATTAWASAAASLVPSAVLKMISPSTSVKFTGNTAGNAPIDTATRPIDAPPSRRRHSASDNSSRPSSPIITVHDDRRAARGGRATGPTSLLPPCARTPAPPTRTPPGVAQVTAP